MSIRIIEQTSDDLEQYATVPIRFLASSTLKVEWVDGGLRGVSLREVANEEPYWYDYDEHEAPTRWRQWDLSNWAFFAAYEGRARIGGAIVARETAGIYLLEGRSDLACLWDLRVRPDRRGTGVGCLLFEHSCLWATTNGSTMLKVETQNINVGACRFYARQGCRLEAWHPNAYEGLPDQVQLLWYLPLESDAI